MKKIFSIALVLVLVFIVLVGEQGAFAGARAAGWLVSIVYQNVGTAPTMVYVDFYTEGSQTPIYFDPLNGVSLGVYGSASLYIGSVSGVSDGFHGSAVLSASQPLATTIVQFSNDSDFKVRMLSPGFQVSDGSYVYYLPTTLKSMYGRTTVFSIQNMGDDAVDVSVKFVKVSDGTQPTPVPTKTWTIPANSTKYIEMDSSPETGLPVGASFDGSAVISAPSGSAIVVTASEMYTDLNVAANFEGVPDTHVGNTIYMASALCHKYGLDTAYAIQNTSGQNAQVVIIYRNPDGSIKATDVPPTIQPGRKISRSTCTLSGTQVPMTDFTGSAIITSAAPLAVVGKAGCYAGICATPPATPSSNGYVQTAFMGESDGASKLALPFIRWSNDTEYYTSTNKGAKQRCSIAIQNLQTTDSSVKVEYYGKNGGTPLKTITMTIKALSKGNTDPSAAEALEDHYLQDTGMITNSFGYYEDGSFGGSVIVKANTTNPSDKYIAIARCGHPAYGEDYNAVHIP